MPTRASSGSSGSGRERPLRAVAAPAAQPGDEAPRRSPFRRLPRRALSRGGPIPEGASPLPVLRRESAYRRLLALADLGAVAASLAVAVVLLGEGDAVTGWALLLLPLTLMLGKVLGLYDRDEHLVNKTTLDEAPALGRAGLLLALVTWVAEGAVVDGTLGQLQVFAVAACFAATALALRVIGRRLARAVTTPERCVIIGDGEAAAWLESKLRSAPATSAVVLGRIPLPGVEEEAVTDASFPPLLGSFEALGLVLAARDVDRVVIAPAESESETILGTVRLVKSLGVRVSVLPRLFEVVGSSVEFDHLDGTVLLGLRRYGPTRSSRILKRWFDLGVALLAVPVLTPLLLAIVAAIKIDSPGPAIYHQRRRGREGREFSMYKFRTMVADAESQQDRLRHLNEAEGVFKIANDPRVTRVGRFLRRTSLDELPQLFNVLRGEMSLVGPRPLALAEDDQTEGWERTRLQLAPGMTGLWQIYGSARIPLREMVKIDYLYGVNWSPWLDLKILLRTVLHVVARRGV